MTAQPSPTPATHSGISLKKTPGRITKVEPDQVFVFGTNLAGDHRGFDASQAIRWQIARHGQGMGMCFSGGMGSSYAIATKDFDGKTLSLPIIDNQIELFLRQTKLLPDLNFLVTSLEFTASYRAEDIAGFFFEDWEIEQYEFAKQYPNVHLPDNYWGLADSRRIDKITDRPDEV